MKERKKFKINGKLDNFFSIIEITIKIDKLKLHNGIGYSTYLDSKPALYSSTSLTTNGQNKAVFRDAWAKTLVSVYIPIPRHRSKQFILNS
ncbi:hypothetical protein BpHYR1_015849 [Brachionus plicatilis]|uniref:Uncharacterized protein n=1 Tax=Brachionus plicatilis TaxID=10195 RepID=A0A3M7P5N5_BRAPC|nr:hypothetical protein BpHYR1_015849 [Brachionus plicatilis]